MKLFTETIGAGEPTLLLLHGVGANGAVFKPLIHALGAWPGRIVVPDLRGHGRSPHATHYSLAHHAADVVELVEPGASVQIAGHSMGGAVALILASGFFGVTVTRVTAFGVKVTWAADELAKGAAFAASPVRWFDTREAAADRFIKVAGLAGHASPGDQVVEAGIREDGGRWRLAADNATVQTFGPPAADIITAVRAPFRLGCGARDPMVTVTELHPFDAQAFAIADSGHSPHVEAPEQLAGVIRQLHLGW